MSRSRTAFALGLVVPLLVVGGCSSDEPQPRIAPSESLSPTDSPSAAPLGPVQTVRAWVEAQNKALTTGDTAELQALSADPCEACDDFIEPIEQVYRDGGHFATPGWTVAGAKARPNTKDPVVVDVGVTVAGGRTVIRAGAEPVVYKTEHQIMVFKLVRQDSRLVVSFIGFIS